MYYYVTEWCYENETQLKVIVVISYVIIYSLEIIILTIIHFISLYNYSKENDLCRLNCCLKCANCGHKHFGKCNHKVSSKKPIESMIRSKKIIDYHHYDIIRFDTKI